MVGNSGWSAAGMQSGRQDAGKPNVVGNLRAFLVGSMAVGKSACGRQRWSATGRQIKLVGNHRPIRACPMVVGTLFGGRQLWRGWSAKWRVVGNHRHLCGRSMAVGTIGRWSAKKRGGQVGNVVGNRSGRQKRWSATNLTLWHMAYAI